MNSSQIIVGVNIPLGVSGKLDLSNASLNHEGFKWKYILYQEYIIHFYSAENTASIQNIPLKDTNGLSTN